MVTNRRGRRAHAVRLEPDVVLCDVLQRQIQRTLFSADGVNHRLRLVSVRPGTDRHGRSVLITVTTDTTHAAQVHLARARLDDPDFVASLLAHAMRAVLTGDLPSNGVEAL